MMTTTWQKIKELSEKAINNSHILETDRTDRTCGI